MAQQPQKGNVPNAYDMNPMMMQMLEEITPQNLPMFLMGNPQLVPQKHLKAIKKSLKNIGTYSLGGFVAGSFLNLMVKKVYINFLAFPVYTRIPLRLGIFAIPFGLLYGKLNENVEIMGENLATIHMKLIRLRKSGNIQEYFQV